MANGRLGGLAHPRRALTARLAGGFGLVVASACLLLAGAAGSAAQTGASFWKVDLHEHSAFSGDARADIGIDAADAKAQNYNAVFLTDHDRLSGFQVSGQDGNYLSFTGTFGSKWLQKSFPTSLPGGSSVTNTTSSTPTPPVSGTTSAHLGAVASTSTNVRTVDYIKRGVGLDSGDAMLDFYVYPQTLGTGGTLDVSASLGGDSSTGVSTFGYTTSNGVAQPAKSTVIYWYLGAAPKGPAGADVYANQLPYTLGAWNHYTIDVTTGAVSWTPAGGATTKSSSTGVNGLSSSDAPMNYDVLSYVKMEAGAVNGTADGYFDNFVMSVTSPQCSASEFVYRDSLIDSGTFNGSNKSGNPFVMFPAREMGQNGHSNQFNFDLTNASNYLDTYKDPGSPNQNDATLCASTNNQNAPWQFSYEGYDNIPAVQASGYPAQDNHPGVTDTVSDVVSTRAHGADTVEVRTDADYSSAWDQILAQNHIVVGTYGSDAHEGVGTATPSSFIEAVPGASKPALNDVLDALFQGRMYMAPGNFGGQIIFNLDGSAEPYPARFPVYVPSSQTSATVQLQITGGLSSGEIVKWFASSNGTLSTDSGGNPIAPTLKTATVSGSTYSGSATVPLSGAFTYVRAAVYASNGTTLVANTEPIFFEAVSGLPAGTSARITSITPPAGTCDCTVAMTKGLASPSWTSGTSTLALTLTDPAASRVQLLIPSGSAPSTVTVDGTSVTASASLAAYQASAGTAWFYDSGAGVMYLADLQSTGTSHISVAYGGGGGGTPAPSVPQGVSASAVSSSEIDLSWSVSSDMGGPGLAGYRVYRDGGSLPVATVTSGTLFEDTGLSASTLYSYTVSAFDVDGNESARSSPAVSATTLSGGGGGGGGGGGSQTFAPLADAYVNSSAPSTNYGRATALRVDSSPSTESYLRFAVSGVSGSVSSVTLRIYANSALKAGFAVAAVADDGWTETGVTYANAPAVGGQLGTSGAVSAGSWVSVTLSTSFVSANGDVDLALVPLSTTALSLGSKESANAPQLIVISSGGGGGGGTPAPSVPQGVSASAVSSSEIDLSWSASSDTGGPGLAGYHVYRNGGSSPVATVTTGTSFKDTGLSASTLYSYTVSAFDVDGNESAPSSPAASATTLSGGGGGGGGGGTLTVACIADTYVNASSPSSNFGVSKALRVDSSPVMTSYLRFDVTGLSGSVSSVTLRIYANSALNAGFAVDAVANDSWTETGTTYANAPAVGAQLGTSGAVSSGSWVEVSLSPSVVSGNGDVDLALVALSTTQLSLGSNESSDPPQLIVTTS